MKCLVCTGQPSSRLTNRCSFLKMGTGPAFACLLALASCHRQPAAPLPQRAYVWQREWTPAVSAAVVQTSPKLKGLVVFGADVSWRDGRPRTLRCTLDWKTLRELRRPIGIVMRIAPWPGPFDDAAITQELVSQARSLLDRAKQEQVPCGEFQIDFDCAQKRLAGYTRWLKALRDAVKPVRFVITTLPAWLDEKSFPGLLDQTDGWVLQVHSAMPEKTGAQVSACDPERARRWVAKAAKLHRPYEVALSTYSAQAGYDESGKMLGLALDGIQPAWPGGTRIMQFDSDADALVKLVNEWQADHPPGMQGILWYRLPVATDQRNWRWPTFAAVLEGRVPSHHLSVHSEGDNPVDLSLINDGEGDEPLASREVRVRWSDGTVTASEALPGWTATTGPGQAVFISSATITQRLSPGARRGIGWLRFDQRAPLHVEIIR